MAKRMNIDPHCQRRNCCAPSLLFNDVCTTLILLGEGDSVSCVLYTKAVTHLPLR